MQHKRLGNGGLKVSRVCPGLYYVGGSVQSTHPCLADLKQLLVDEPNYEYRAIVLSDIEHNKRLIDIVSRVIPG